MANVLGSCNSCCSPVNVNDNDEIDVSSTGCCYKYETTTDPCGISAGVTFTNTSAYTLNINVSGACDDDVMFNGVVYENGEYPYFNPPVCTYVNGAHSFEYNSTISSGSSILIQNVDNGYSGGMTCTIKFS